MLTRGKRRAAPGTVGTSAGSKKARSKRTTPTVSKRARTGQGINSLNGSHPSQLQRQPLAPPQNVLSVDIGTPAASSSSVPNIPSGSSIPALTSAISAAVIKGLTDAGIFTSTNVNVAQNTSQTVAAVQESVADVVDNLSESAAPLLDYACKIQSFAFQESTKRNMRTQLNAYLLFCDHFALIPFPVSK